MAFQLSKTGAGLPLLRAEFGLSLTQGGVIFGVVPVALALLGALGGQYFSRFGMRRVGVVSMAFLAVGSLGGMSAGSFASLFAWRLLESCGYLTGIIAMPALLAASVTGKARNTAMGLWSGFVPAGFTLMLLLSGPLVALGGWRALWLLAAGLPASVGVLIFFLFPRDEPTTRAPAIDFTDLRHHLRSPVAWALALSFMLFSMFFISVVNFLPEYLTSTTGHALGSINALIGMAIFLSALSNVFGGWLLNHRSVRYCANATMLAMFACAVPIFAPHVPDWARFAPILLFCALSGMLPGAFWAYMPSSSPSLRRTTALTGMVMQLSASGQLLGAVVVGAVVDATGTWTSVLLVTLAFTIACLALSCLLPGARCRSAPAQA